MERARVEIWEVRLATVVSSSVLMMFGMVVWEVGFCLLQMNGVVGRCHSQFSSLRFLF